MAGLVPAIHVLLVVSGAAGRNGQPPPIMKREGWSSSGDVVPAPPPRSQPSPLPGGEPQTPAPRQEAPSPPAVVPTRRSGSSRGQLLSTVIPKLLSRSPGALKRSAHSRPAAILPLGPERADPRPGIEHPVGLLVPRPVQLPLQEVPSDHPAPYVPGTDAVPAASRSSARSTGCPRTRGGSRSAIDTLAVPCCRVYDRNDAAATSGAAYVTGLCRWLPNASAVAPDMLPQGDPS